MSTDWNTLGKNARAAAYQLAAATTDAKNTALAAIANAIQQGSDQILAANAIDLQSGKENGLSESLLDRLALSRERLAAMITGINEVIALPDPVGVSLANWNTEVALHIEKVSVPLGVVGIIYEARPNVTVDAAVLCLKAGNAVVLRGSSSAIESNKALVAAIQAGLLQAGFLQECVQLVTDIDRESVSDFLKQRDYIDVMIPRGGAGLIQFVCENSTVPVLETGAGNCHVFIDASADPGQAVAIVINAKTQRPSVCNAIETVLIHEAWPVDSLQTLLRVLQQQHVRIKACEKTRVFEPALESASETDWETEYLELTLAVKIVADVNEAVAHINRYGTKHSECIVTAENSSRDFFFQNVDAAAVYHNASTRFTDGFQFGFGAEIGISTQKLHARGPMGLTELTSYKYLCRGHGQIRA